MLITEEPATMRYLPDVQSDPGHPDQFDTDGGTDPEVHAAAAASPADPR